MKTASIILALSMALAGSAAPQTTHNEVRQFGGFGNNGGRQQNNNNNANGGQQANNGANGGRQINNGATGGQQNTKGNANNNAGAGQQGKNQGNTKGNAGNNTAGNNNQNAGGAGAANNTANTGAGAANNTTNTGAGAANNQDPQTSTTLDPKVIAQGFANDGQDIPADGQVASLTSTNNFINFCLTVPNLPITDGKQITAGSCNPAPMGVLPSTDNMPSSKFVFPKNGDVVKENTAFTIQMAIRGMQTGFFVNAQENYFAAPQFLNGQGQIQGHSHVVVELLDSVAQTTPTDPKKFAFFKGLNAAAANGQLTADVTAGLPAGAYKLSSINSAANHQPVLVPIAQHGSLDDAVYFTVTADGQADAGSTGNAGNAGAANNTNTGAAAQTANQNTKGAAAQTANQNTKGAAAQTANQNTKGAAAQTANQNTKGAAAQTANQNTKGAAAQTANQNTKGVAAQNANQNTKGAAAQNTKGAAAQNANNAGGRNRRFTRSRL